MNLKLFLIKKTNKILNRGDSQAEKRGHQICVIFAKSQLYPLAQADSMSLQAVQYKIGKNDHLFNFTVDDMSSKNQHRILYMTRSSEIPMIISGSANNQSEPPMRGTQDLKQQCLKQLKNKRKKKKKKPQNTVVGSMNGNLYCKKAVYNYSCPRIVNKGISKFRKGQNCKIVKTRRGEETDKEICAVKMLKVNNRQDILLMLLPCPWGWRSTNQIKLV